jgi:hypothetical protein
VPERAPRPSPEPAQPGRPEPVRTVRS